MSRRILPLVAVAVMMSATSAMALGWPNTPVKKVSFNSAAAPSDCCTIKAEQKTNTGAAGLVAADGFEYVGGDAVWQLAQHKYDLRAGKLAMAADCPVSIAKAKAAAIRKDPA